VRRLLLLLPLLLGLALAGPAQAVDAPPCEESTVTSIAQADAWVDENGALSNGGSDAILSVRSAADGKNARALVRFAIPAAPAGCVVEHATLRMFASSGDASARLEAVRLAFGWSESLVTWGSQPPAVGAAAVAWGGDGYVQWNVRSQVEDILGTANHGFVIRDADEGAESGGDQSFHSREKGDSPPELVLRFAAPETEAPGPPAEPTPAAVSCGQEITRSVLVTNDLTDCPGDGLVIADDRIILDLGGRTIDGVGLGTGIRNDGFDLVTVRNGTIQEFDHGVQLLPETDLNLIERLSLRHNQIGGIELADAGEVGAGNEVRANLVEQNGDGIALTKGTSGALVAGNTMTLSGGPGLWLAQSDGNRLEANSVTGSGDLGVGLEHSTGNTLVGNDVSGNSDGGIEVRAGSHGNRIEGNTVSDSGDTGIMVSESDRNEVIGNHASGLSDSGITLDAANDGVVRGNDVPSNPGGIELDGSSRNLVELNDASDTDGIGLHVGTDSVENELVANIAVGNAAQGIYVSDETSAAQGNLLDRNVASGNGSDGIMTAKGGHTLSFNVANDNRGWGMHAAPGTIDGRGNVALRNGTSGQCSGVVCNADVTPPETSLGGAPVDPTSSAAAAFSFSARDDRTSAAALRFQCSLDGAAFAACTSPRLYSGLPEGEHRFEVRALDQAGNVDPSPAVHEWTVDRTPPDTTIESGPPQQSASHSASFSFGGTDDHSAAGELEFECRVGAEEEFDDCHNPAVYENLLEGSYSFEVRAVDEAGNVDASPAIRSWTVDTTAPETSIESGPAGPTSERSARISFGSNEPGASFECRLNEGDFAPCSSPQLLSALSEGPQRFEVRATDPAGNADGSPAVHAWTVDVTPPETTVGSGPPDPFGSRRASISFAGEDDRSPASALRFECRLDGEAAFSTCASPVDYAELAEGGHAFEVRAVDLAGNVDSSPATHAWTVDTTAPETTIDAGPADYSGESSARFEFSAGEPGSRFECRLDDGAFAPCETGEFYTDLADGQHRFEVRAVDLAGNVDGSPALHAWTVDTTAPETTLGERPADPSGDSAARFEFSASEPGSRFDCRLDDGAFAPCETGEFYTDLADGQHRFEVRAIDRAGNTDQSPAVHEWTVDTEPEPPADMTPPETTLDDRPGTPTASQSAGFTFTGADDVTPAGALRFECRLDDSPFGFTACSSPQLYSGLGDGSHTFEVRAVDAAGNADRSPATHGWTIDGTAPETTIGSGPATATSSTSASFTFTSSEPGSTFECSLDNAAFAACTSPRQYSGLSSGSHQFRVRARDALGNLDGSPAVRTWTIDTAAPQTTIATGPQGTTGPDATFTFTSNESGATFECSLDNAAFAPCTSPKQYTGLSSGSHQFRVRARDAAGNVDGSPASRSWTVDATPPQTNLGSVPPATTSSTSASFTFTASESGSTFQCRLDDGSFEPCTSPRTYQALSEGQHTFAVRATDARGNQDQSPATHTWTVTPPPTGCVPSTVTAGAAADSWVLQSSAGTNYATDSTIKVDSKNGGNARVLVRFSLPAVPPACQVTDAKLRLYSGSYKTGRTLEALRIVASWTETGVRWNDQPGTTGTAATAPSGSGYVQWTVTEQVQAMYSSGNNGFLVRDASENGDGVEQGFNSREKGSDNPPRLVVTFG
jgi:parallel beta-helix repeat protein